MTGGYSLLITTKYDRAVKPGAVRIVPDFVAPLRALVYQTETLEESAKQGGLDLLQANAPGLCRCAQRHLDVFGYDIKHGPGLAETQEFAGGPPRRVIPISG